MHPLFLLYATQKNTQALFECLDKDPHYDSTGAWMIALNVQILQCVVEKVGMQGHGPTLMQSAILHKKPECADFLLGKDSDLLPVLGSGLLEFPNKVMRTRDEVSYTASDNLFLFLEKIQDKPHDRLWEKNKESFSDTERCNLLAICGFNSDFLVSFVDSPLFKIFKENWQTDAIFLSQQSLALSLLKDKKNTAASKLSKL